MIRELGQALDLIAASPSPSLGALAVFGGGAFALAVIAWPK